MTLRAADVGIVVIGRNEGARLRAAIASMRGVTERIVYVDSGSTDGSVQWVRGQRVEAVVLDPDAPFTAARARHAGVARVAALWPDTAFVQFIDGDCTLARGWIPVALRAMARDPTTAVVFGRRRERYPEATIYNRLCDMEWDGAAGVVDSCGGDSLMRLAAYRDAGGFSAELIAGEEPDLCHRLRRRGWRVVRVAAEMTMHDAAMTRWTQWWQRNRRSGYAGAEAWHRRGGEDPRLLRHVVSNLVWALPVAWPLWPVLWLRVYRRAGALYASHIVIGKLPHGVGQLGFWWARLRSARATLIEYK